MPYHLASAGLGHLPWVRCGYTPDDEKKDAEKGAKFRKKGDPRCHPTDTSLEGAGGNVGSFLMREMFPVLLSHAHIHAGLGACPSGTGLYGAARHGSC